MRIVLAAFVFSMLLSAFCAPLAAQTNPIPFVNNPLSPASAVPGAAGFTLTVNGAGFVSGAVVNWNGSALAATVINSNKLTAAIPASNLLIAGTIPVTVSNAAPGGGVSNVVLFEITAASTSLAFMPNVSDMSKTIFSPTGMAVGYASSVSTPVLGVANLFCTTTIVCTSEHSTISLLGLALENYAYTGDSPGSLAFGDFNGDGILDFVTLGTKLSVSRGPIGHVQPYHLDYPLPTGALNYVAPVLGDFKPDGKLGLALATTTGVALLPGNGDGTFGLPIFTQVDVNSIGTFVAAGDFNGDGILDLAVSSLDLSGSSVSILLGNGDGTFQLFANYAFTSFTGHIAAADFNGDGKLDLAVFDFLPSGTSIAILLRNGDGTFAPRVDYAAGVSPVDFALGDFDGDGNLDIAVADSSCVSPGTVPCGSVNVLLGKGDGSFQSHLDFKVTGSPQAIVSGEFNYFGGPPVGKTGFAVTNPSANSVTIFTAIPTNSGNPLPVISAISPTSAIQASGGFTLTVNGASFVSGSQISFGGQIEATTVVNSGQLTAQIPNTAISGAGSVSVLVTNPAPGGGNSTSLSFNVYLPPPTISSINPNSVVAGSPNFLLTINGTNFVSSSQLNVNGVAQAVTYVNASQVTATIPASLIAAPGSVSLSITNPLGGPNFSGGGTSSTVTLPILAANSQPTIGGLSPASATVGGPSFTLTITGTGFTPSSVVTFNMATVPSAFAFANPTTLQATIPASAIAVAGTPLVAVSNPGGTTSVAKSFAVNNTVPVAATLSPSIVAPGSAALTLTVTGTNFNSSSVVQLNGSPRVTTFGSSASIAAALTSADFVNTSATNLTLNITVSNPAPGGGTSAALIITVPDFSLSAPAALSTVAAGQPANFTLAVTASSGANGLGGNLTFSISPLPALATASFSPPSLPAGTKSTNVTLMIATAPHTARTVPLFPRAAWPRPVFWSAFVFLLGMMWFGFRAVGVPAQRYVPQFLAVLLLAIASALAACGSSTGNFTPQFNPSSGTPAGTYPITVTAVSGNVSLTTTITMNVN